MNIVTVGNYKVGQGCPMLLMAGPLASVPKPLQINSACPMFLRHLSIKQTVLPIILSAGRD